MYTIHRGRGVAFLLLVPVMFATGLSMSIAFEWSRSSPSVLHVVIDNAVAANMSAAGAVWYALGLILSFALAVYVILAGRTNRALRVAALVSTGGGLAAWGLGSALQASASVESSSRFWLTFVAWLILSELVIWGCFVTVAGINESKLAVPVV
jgi:hypothetical protein